MREFTGQRDMVRTANTRFATAFLTLKRFQVQQANLRKMFKSEKWAKSRYFREAAGKRVAEVILMSSFWKTTVFALKVGGPLLKVLRLVDGEKRSPMGYIYEAMDIAKEAIAESFNNNEDKYRGIFEIIDKRWNVQMHHPLHAAGYFLNPEFFYSNRDIENDEEVLEGLYKCIVRLVRGEDLQDKITNQLDKYKKTEGLFGLRMSIRQRASKSPGYERNWSVFEHIHSKKRNRLSQQRLNDLAYIKYNRALRRRYAMRDEIDPISLSEIDDINEWLLGKLDDSDNENDDNDVVFEDDDLRWSDVAQAVGVGETKRKQSSTRTSLVDEVDEEEINIDVETEEEEEDADGYKSSDGADDIDLEDEDDDYNDI
ncbi:uncharacterized protein LOC142510171 [Primulina tabacum]|uniref:uncharacterized protein LOC142510171 n=1 Tax=Primulina tabacum TaxID=48773 RepID=UPI003F5A5DB2